MNISTDHVGAIPPAVPTMLHGRPIGPRRVSNAQSMPPPQQPLQNAPGPIPQENGAAAAAAPPPPLPEGALPVPGAVKPPGTMPQPMVQPPGLPNTGIQQFDGSRSPPGNKNLSHVPCKFFKVGTCQAGKACPFSHSIEVSSDAPCKYFQKGNCKFGAKCALAHILPDGRKINRPNFNGGHLQLGGRINPEHYTNHRSALHNSLMQANMINQHNQHLPHQPPHNFANPDDFPALPNQQQQDALQQGIYGSPGAEPHVIGSLAASQRTLGPLDATLPASLDSNGLSHFARHGPFASSVPSKFGLESPPMSVPSERGGALRSLYMSAFGDEDSMSNSPGAARSPQLGDDAFGARFMHSSKRSLRPGIMSSSFPTVMGGWPERLPTDANDDIDSVFEEDYIPGSLQELLTEKEKIRRFSRTEDESSRRPVFGGFSENQHSVVGSPPMSSSPRFGPLFVRNKREDDTITSGIGHVGSPLRNSYMNEISPIGRASNRDSADMSFPASPPVAGMSALSAQLSRTRLSENVYAQDITASGSSSPVVGPQSTIGSKKTDAPSSGPKLSMDDDTQFPMEEDEEVSSGPSKGRPMGLGVNNPW